MVDAASHNLPRPKDFAELRKLIAADIGLVQNGDHKSDAVPGGGIISLPTGRMAFMKVMKIEQIVGHTGISSPTSVLREEQKLLEFYVAGCLFGATTPGVCPSEPGALDLETPATHACQTEALLRRAYAKQRRTDADNCIKEIREMALSFVTTHRWVSRDLALTQLADMRPQAGRVRS